MLPLQRVLDVGVGHLSPDDVDAPRFRLGDRVSDDVGENGTNLASISEKS